MLNQLNSKNAIGVFDSGLGGLTVLKELRRALPNESFVYFGDTARTPYGNKSSETILRYGKEAVHFLLEQQVKLLVVACNTVSSVGLDLVAAGCEVPILGTIEPAIDSLSAFPHQKVGVIGTQATISSRSYERQLQARYPQIEILSKACPLFVPLVEQGMYDGEIVTKIIELYLADWKSEGLDALILGCTHYPMLAPALRRYLGDTVNVVECSRAVSVAARRLLIKLNLAVQDTELRPAPERYFVTDDIGRFNALAEVFLDRAWVQAVQIDHLQHPDSSETAQLKIA